MANKILFLGPLVLAGWMLAACSSTTLTSSWKDESHAGQPLDKVFVVGATDPERNRRILEDEFVRQLQSRAVEGVSSYRLLPTEAMLSKQGVESKIRGKGFDAVLVVSLLNRRTEVVQHAGRIETDRAGGWHGRYSRRHEATYTPPTTTEFQVAVLECDVYDTASEKLIWTGTFETEIHGSVNQAVESFVSNVIKSLASEKLIP